MAKNRIRRKKKDPVNSGAGRLESRLRGTKYAGARIGPSDDRFEREADVTANRVVAGAPPDPMFDHRPDPDAVRTPQIGENPPPSGERLPADELGFYQRKMGFNFANVRIHADARAHAVTRSINAKAFTKGPEIAFAQGAYNPKTTEGRRLIAHELAHVVQQSGGTSALSGAQTDSVASPAEKIGGLSPEAGAPATNAVQRQLAFPEEEPKKPEPVQEVEPEKEPKKEPEKPKDDVDRFMPCEQKFLVMSVVGKAWLGPLDAKGQLSGGKLKLSPKQVVELGWRIPRPSEFGIGLEKGAKVVLLGKNSKLIYKLRGPGEKSEKSMQVFSCSGKVRQLRAADLFKKRKRARSQAPTASTGGRF